MLLSNCPPHQRAAVTPFHGKRVTRSSHRSQKTVESQSQSSNECSYSKVLPNEYYNARTGLEFGSEDSESCTLPLLQFSAAIKELLLFYGFFLLHLVMSAFSSLNLPEKEKIQKYARRPNLSSLGGASFLLQGPYLHSCF